MIIIKEKKPYVTSFNSQIPLAEFRFNEQQYTRTTKIWYHASVSKLDKFVADAPKRDPLTHFSSKKEFSIDFYRYYRGRRERFGYLHFCRLEKSVDLVNFQSEYDYNKVISRFPEIKEFIDINLLPNDKGPRYFVFMEDKKIIFAAKTLGYDGVATFGDNPNNINNFHGAENIGLFNATVMRVTDIRMIDLTTGRLSKNTFLFAPDDQAPDF